MYVPHRRPGEKLQVLAVVNFKGGSGKTTTAAHVGQYLALTGHRVLAIDLDPQASLTSLHGFQPELDQTKSIYDAIRYDDERVPLSEVIQRTNFPGLDIVPANLELQEYEYDTPLAMADRNSNAGKAFFTRISNALAEVDDRYDVVVVDCLCAWPERSVALLLKQAGEVFQVAGNPPIARGAHQAFRKTCSFGILPNRHALASRQKIGIRVGVAHA